MAFASIKASAKGGKDFEIAPAGVHLAICTKIVHVGFQSGGKYGDKDTVWLEFQLPDVRQKYQKDGVDIDAPAIVRRKFTLSLSEKSQLRPFLEAWRGKPFTKEEEEGFEIATLAGKVCQLQIIHEASNDGKKTYANIAGAFGLVKEQKEALTANPARAKPHGDLVVYSVNDESRESAAVYDALPKFLRDMIDSRVKQKSAEDYSQASDHPDTTTQDFNDDIPF